VGGGGAVKSSTRRGIRAAVTEVQSSVDAVIPQTCGIQLAMPTCVMLNYDTGLHVPCKLDPALQRDDDPSVVSINCTLHFENWNLVAVIPLQEPNGF